MNKAEYSQCVYQGDGPCNGCLKRGPPMIKTCFIPKEFGDLSLLTESSYTITLQYFRTTML